MVVFSAAIRRRVIEDSQAGLPTKVVAEKYGMSRTWVRALKKRWRETGDLTPGQSSGRPRKIDREQLQQLVREDPDATLVELRDRLGVECAPTAIWMALAALKITFKKKRSARSSRTGPTSPNAAPPGVSGNSGSTRNRSSSSTKRGPRRT